MLAARCCLRSYPLTAATDHWCTYQDDAPAAMPACSRTCTTHRTRGTRPPKLRTFGKQSSRPSSWLVMCGSSGAATDDRTGSTTCYRMANTLHQPTATWPPAAAQPCSTQPRTQISHHTLLNTSRVRQISREFPAVRSRSEIHNFSANLSQYKIFHDFMHMRARYKPGTSGRSMQVEQRKKSTCPNEGVSADPALPACQNPSTH